MEIKTETYTVTSACPLQALLKHPLSPRGTLQGQLDDVERAINNAVNAFKALTRDARCLAAGGAAEVELGRQLQV